MDKIKVGIARECITPPLGVAMSGYFSPRHAKGVYDDLYATAAVFDDGVCRCAVVALDLCGLKNPEYQERYKELIHKTVGIPPEAVIFNCSHTHTGPIVGYDKSSGAESSPEYDESLGISIAKCVKRAADDLGDAQIYTAGGEAKDVAFIRLFRMKDGSAKTNPGILNPDILHPLAEVNERLTLVKIVRDGKSTIFMVNFGVHADTIGGEYVSADFIGVMRRTLEAAIPNTMCMFIQGAEGDVNHVNVKYGGKQRGLVQAEYMGHALAGTVLKICDRAVECRADDIAIASREIEIPTNRENHRLEAARRIVELHRSGRDAEIETGNASVTTVVAEALRIIGLENGPDSYRFTLTALRLGDIAIAALPGEPFSEIGRRIIAASPVNTTLVAALTNGGEIYFPTANIYKEGGYEARSSLVKAGADDILVGSMIELLGEVKKSNL